MTPKLPPEAPSSRKKKERGERLRLNGGPSKRIVPSHQMIKNESEPHATAEIR